MGTVVEYIALVLAVSICEAPNWGKRGSYRGGIDWNSARIGS